MVRNCTRLLPGLDHVTLMEAVAAGGSTWSIVYDGGFRVACAPFRGGNAHRGRVSGGDAEAEVPCREDRSMSYRLNGYSRDFYTGRTGDGRQVLMGLLCPELDAYF